MKSLVLAVVGLAIAACSFQETASPVQEAAPPDAQEILRGVATVYRAANLTGIPQVSPLQRAHPMAMTDWILCLRANEPETYGVLLTRGGPVGYRVAVGVDQCNVQTYSPILTPLPATGLVLRESAGGIVKGTR